MKQKLNMPKGYAVMWGVFTLAYAIWMSFFMNKIVLKSYATVAQRTIDGITHSDITGMIGREWLYPIWVVASCALMLMFIFYIKKYLYSDVGKVAKAFALVSLIFGFVFVTWYGFLENPFENTASMIGLEHPWAFRGWGIFATLSIFINTLLAYNKFNFNSKLGVIAGSVGCAALFITINVPSYGEELVLTSMRCMSHWTGALVFAFAAAAPVVIFLFNMAFKRKNKKFVFVFFVFCAILALMVVLLVTIGKDGIIEGIPVWTVYIVLLFVNFTPLLDEKKAEEKIAVTK